MQAKKEVKTSHYIMYTIFSFNELELRVFMYKSSSESSTSKTNCFCLFFEEKKNVNLTATKLITKIERREEGAVGEILVLFWLSRNIDKVKEI